MKIALVGAELEENLGLRYIAASLEKKEHHVELVPFNTRHDILDAAKQVTAFDPQVTGFSMVFTGRGREFCELAQTLREQGYQGHLIAGGHFACLNCEQLLRDFSGFSSIALGEGEDIMCGLVENLDDLSKVPGLCYRKSDGSISINPSIGNPEDLDGLPFPKRTTFQNYFGKSLANVLSSRGCYRDCAFCSINAWYKQSGGKKFRLRSIENLVAEMKELYFRLGVRIFNFHDDNFFHPDPKKAVQRFDQLRSAFRREGIEGIAFAVKARPDSITPEAIGILDDLGLFRVFLGVENFSVRGLSHLNRKCDVDQILNALKILNDFDTHVAYNLLLFEPDTLLDDIRINLRFMERNMNNPFNFCRAEVYSGTGLEEKLRAENRLLGDYFGFDYRISDPQSEAFHQIANYAFFDRNFDDMALHYLNMQVDFLYQVLRRFQPGLLTMTLRGAVRNFVKETNMDTYQCLCQIYDFVSGCFPADDLQIRAFAKEMRIRVDSKSQELKAKGELLLQWLEVINAGGSKDTSLRSPLPASTAGLSRNFGSAPYEGPSSPGQFDLLSPEMHWFDGIQSFGVSPYAVPYTTFKEQLARQQEERG